MVKTNIPATANVGLEPPPDAPREVSQPLTAEAIAEHQAKARVNERELAPLTYGKGPTVATDQPSVPGEVQAPKEVVAAPGYPQPSKYVDAPMRSEFPAASNGESPSRGIPGTAPVPAARRTAPLQAVGGFGEAEAEYFPLDGKELKTLVEQLLDELHERIQNDLRFSMAVTYPRLSAKLMLVIEGEVEDQAFAIEKQLPPNGKWTRTPLEVAQAHGDSVVFVVTQQRREFTDEGEVESPADALRDELGLPVPHKRQVKMGVGSALVDVTW